MVRGGAAPFPWSLFTLLLPYPLPCFPINCLYHHHPWSTVGLPLMIGRVNMLLYVEAGSNRVVGWCNACKEQSRKVEVPGSARAGKLVLTQLQMERKLGSQTVVAESSDLGLSGQGRSRPCPGKLRGVPLDCIFSMGHDAHATDNHIRKQPCESYQRKGGE